MSSHLVIAKIGTMEELRESATPTDLLFVEQFGSESRQREVLSWRAIVHRELSSECEICYDDYGAPNLSLVDRYISVSHSKESVAVLFSDRPCAVDIEQQERNFSKVASRYLSDAERTLAEKGDLYAEMWCAKEAIYKYYKKGNLDFVKHIKIVEYNAERGQFIATILDGAPIEVTLSRRENLVIAVIA